MALRCQDWLPLRQLPRNMLLPARLPMSWMVTLRPGVLKDRTFALRVSLLAKWTDLAEKINHAPTPRHLYLVILPCCFWVGRGGRRRTVIFLYVGTLRTVAPVVQPAVHGPLPDAVCHQEDLSCALDVTGTILRWKRCWKGPTCRLTMLLSGGHRHCAHQRPILSTRKRNGAAQPSRPMDSLQFLVGS